MMFNRFADQTREVVKLAYELAAPPRQPIGREHLLVALASTDEPALRAAGADPQELRAALRRVDPDAADAAALGQLGIDLAAVAEQVDARFGPGTWAASGGAARRGYSTRQGRLTPGGRKALELSLREAIADHSRTITTRHLLRGLLRDPGPRTSALIETFTTVPALRAQLGL